MNDPNVGMILNWPEDILTAQRVERSPYGYRGLECVGDIVIGGDLITCVRIEQMSKKCYWGKIYMRDGRAMVLSFTATPAGLIATAEWE